MTIKKFCGSLLIGFLCTAAAFAQTQPDAKPASTEVEIQAIDEGKLEGVRYTNNFFGISFSIPGNWRVLSAPKDPKFAEDLKNSVRTEDPAKRDQLNDSIDRSKILLSLTKLPTGEPDNASMLLIAERIPSPAIKTAADVVRSMRKALAGTNFNVEFQGEPETRQIGGAEFATMNLKTTSPHGVFMQRVYITVKQPYALELFFTYVNAADLPTLDTLIQSIKVN